MISNKADAVRLADGDIAHIVKGGAQHPLTRQPLGDGQLLLLLREMAPPEIVPTLSGNDPVEFVYANPDGRFVTRVSRENGTLRATVSAAPANAVVEAVAPSPGANGNGSSHGHVGFTGNGVSPNGHMASPPHRWQPREGHRIRHRARKSSRFSEFWFPSTGLICTFVSGSRQSSACMVS
jgi:hypothetical protein